MSANLSITRTLFRSIWSHFSYNLYFLIQNMNIKQEKICSGDLVWASMKYSPYWPAKVVVTPPQFGKTPSNKLCVLFFGTKQL